MIELYFDDQTDTLICIRNHHVIPDNMMQVDDFVFHLKGETVIAFEVRNATQYLTENVVQQVKQNGEANR